MKYKRKGGCIEADIATEETKLTCDSGEQVALKGDYIITQPDGEQYPCKPEKFQELYELVGEAKNSVTPADIDSILDDAKIEFSKLGEKTTLVYCTLKNGFTFVESSSCVSPKNFDMDIGLKNCMEKIKDQLWMLEGYKLQCQLGGE